MVGVRSKSVRGGAGLALIAVMWAPGSAGAADAAVCGGREATIVGTEGPDELVGLPGPDVIVGLGGDDHITGDVEADYVCGDEGDDTIDTAGYVAVYGGPGNDTIVGPSMGFAFGGPGDDHLELNGDDPQVNAPLHGEDGDDTLLGGPGSDEFYPGLGRDIVEGGPSGGDAFHAEVEAGPISIDLARGFAKGQGRDTVTEIEEIFGTDFPDRLAGDDGPNLISSYADAEGPHDVIIGRGGQDFLEPRGGTVLAGRGNDIIAMRYVCCRDATDDHFDGGGGYDWFRFDITQGLHGAEVRFDLEAGTATGRYVGNDVMLRFEAAEGTRGADTFLGNDADNRFKGEIGDDHLEGRGGNDTLGGGRDADTLLGGDGDDQIDGGEGDDTLDGGEGEDTLDGWAGTDICTNGETVTYCE